MPSRRACDICSKRKIQCSIPESGPPCNWCSHQKINCTFTREPQRKKHITVDHVRDLYRRIEQLEGSLSRRHDDPQQTTQTSPTTTIDAPITSSQIGSAFKGHHPNPLATYTPLSVLSIPREARSVEPSLETRAIPFHGSHSGLNWYFKGMRLFSAKGEQWLSSRTGQAVTLETFRALDLKLSFPVSTIQIGIFSQVQDKLPGERASIQAMEVLYQSQPYLSYPFLDYTCCLDTIRKAYRSTSDGPPLSSQVAAMAFVWALHAISFRLQSKPEPSRHAESEECANQAQLLLSSVSDESDRETLEAILLLQTYRVSNGQWRTSSSLHSLACRIVCDLGGHFFPSISPPAMEDPSVTSQRQHIRNLFWLCYILDKDISLRLERPPLLTKDHCDLTLPSTKGSMHDNYPILQLGVIKEEVLRLLCSPRALTISESELLLNIRQLDADLEHWRLSVPPPLRPRLAIPWVSDQPLLPHETSLQQQLNLITLQLDYHYVMIIVHTTVRRCGSSDESENLPENLHNVVHSSVDLTLEAGRSVLVFLETLIDLLGDGALRHIVFYAPVAAMALFVNVVVHPFGQKAQADVDLLNTAVGTIKGILQQSISTDQRRLVNRLAEFVLELGRLGDAAIEKARLQSGLLTPSAS